MRLRNTCLLVLGLFIVTVFAGGCGKKGGGGGGGGPVKEPKATGGGQRPLGPSRAGAKAPKVNKADLQNGFNSFLAQDLIRRRLDHLQVVNVLLSPPEPKSMAAGAGADMVATVELTNMKLYYWHYPEYPPGKWDFVGSQTR